MNTTDKDGATRTKNAKQLLAMMKATMNLDLDELIDALVIEGRDGRECSPWTKWNKDAPTFIAKLDDRRLNALAALIKHKFPDAFPPSDTELLRQAGEALWAWQEWEADIIMNGDWSNSRPRLTQSQYDRMIEMQEPRRAVLTAYDKREQS